MNKTILINPKFMKVSKEKKKRKTRRRERKNAMDININTDGIKKKLMKKIQDHRRNAKSQERDALYKFTHKIKPMNKENNSNKKQEPTKEEIKNKIKFNNEFNDSLNYFKKMAEEKDREKKEKKKEKKRMKQMKRMQQRMQNVIPRNQTAKHQLKPEPKYGILKGGKKMLYSEYKNRTRKKYSDLKRPPSINTTPTKIEPNKVNSPGIKLPPTPMLGGQSKALSSGVKIYTENQPSFEIPSNTHKNNVTTVSITPPSHIVKPHYMKELDGGGGKVVDETTDKENEKEKKTEISYSSLKLPKKKTRSKRLRDRKRRKRRILKRTIRQYKLGRNKSPGKPRSLKIGVLLSNEKMKTEVKEYIANIEKIPIKEIKQHLKKCNLLSIGSCAPEKILRETYKNSILAGNIENHDAERLMERFMDAETEDFD